MEKSDNKIAKQNNEQCFTGFFIKQKKFSNFFEKKIANKKGIRYNDRSAISESRTVYS
ncbi:MAG TPA: hypothetical protein H9669_04865 [Firmicutes bacterium]|nr:hypothetical protein [Bacillota bacterium]